MRHLLIGLFMLCGSVTSTVAQVSIGIGFPGVSIGIDGSRSVSTSSSRHRSRSPVRARPSAHRDGGAPKRTTGREGADRRGGER